MGGRVEEGSKGRWLRRMREMASEVNRRGKMIGGLPPQKVRGRGIERVATLIGKKIKAH